MSRKWIAAWIFLTGMVVLLLPWAIPTHAQEATPENDANCMACHEHQYYLYDSGKCSACVKRRCTASIVMGAASIHQSKSLPTRG
jgi:hypothetical protein